MNGITQHEVNIAEAATLLEILTDAGDSVMLWGTYGIGKTDIVHQLGARKNRKVLEFHAALRETVDLRGIPVPDLVTGKTRWLVPDELPQAERDGEFGYLFADEINQANPQMQAILGGLFLYGTVGDYRLPPGWRVIGAGNRISDKAAAQRMPTHLRNRLAHLYVTPDVDAWCKWANANDVPAEIVAYIRLRRENLHVPFKGDENATPTPRSWTKASKYINAPAKHRLRLFASLVGDAYAADLEAFLELYRSLGSLDDIIADPDGAPVPTEPSCRFAVCTGLGRMATRKSLPSIITYAKRLPRESEILVVHDATTRDEKLKETQAYGAWACANQDIILQM
jgi:hypothetical protein